MGAQPGRVQYLTVHGCLEAASIKSNVVVKLRLAKFANLENLPVLQNTKSISPDMTRYTKFEST